MTSVECPVRAPRHRCGNVPISWTARTLPVEVERKRARRMLVVQLRFALSRPSADAVRFLSERQEPTDGFPASLKSSTGLLMLLDFVLQSLAQTVALQVQLVVHLKAEPELRGHAEKPRQAQGCVGC